MLSLLPSLLTLSLAAPGNPPPLSGELVPAGERIQLAVILKYSDPKALAAEVKHDQATGQPPLSASEIGEKYGPSPADYRRLQNWFTAAGFVIQDSNGVGRMVIATTGTAAQVNQLFGVRLHRVKGQPPKIHAPEGKPRYPDWVKDLVSIIQGFDNRPNQFKETKHPHTGG